MNQWIEAHVYALLADVPKNMDISAIREKLIYDLNLRYDELCLAGKSPEEAFHEAIREIGDLDDILAGYHGTFDTANRESDRLRAKRRTVMALGIILYIVSIIPFVLLATRGYVTAAVATFLVMAFIATLLVCFGSRIGRMQYVKTDNGTAEYTEYTEEDKKKRKKIMGTITSTFWLWLTAMYFVISFMSGAWYITWILFVAGACIQQLFEMFFAGRKKRRELAEGAFWTGITTVYLFVSMTMGGWAYTWVIFLIAAGISGIAGALWKQ